TIADFHGLLDALRAAAVRYMMLQLDLACWYSFAFGALGAEPADDDPRWHALRMLAYDLVANADLWQRFCADAGLDPDLLLKDYPGFATLQEMMDAARLDAYTPEEAAAYLRRHKGAETAGSRVLAGECVYRMRAIEEQVKEFREIVEHLAKRWQ